MTAPLRVLLVDDQALIRSGFAMMLSVEDDLEVVGQASTGREAIDLAAELHPDVIVMDVQMPVMDGITATREVVARDLGRVIILTTFDSDDYLFAALQAGASGFLLKNAQAEQLVDALRAVGHGHALLAPEVTQRVIAQMSVGPATQPGGTGRHAGLLGQLTDRERDVLRLMGVGRSNAEIADELVIGAATVKTHVSSIFAKLQVRDRVGAVIIAHESGLVVDGGSAG
ncbi:LuxR family two component transcriptional regulator [Janibacter hoylei PVAS-1]|uniref:DNA-binding response regulator n=1 Tax=Janibacter hoylei PVAS-1 TaxID=1210046 RepID=K1E167_9MICO|nr:response regulator transcription factor [Janibacter hoylei]EKA62444.1 LuxR family two component transcriptional regulator [Janibacter hoylei PVAS-1]RWU83069.1 DNA-binding response regulator [Janibacter hoylei PVAS-1]